MKRLFAACVLLLCGLSPAEQALAWNDTGHMAIAYVAYSRLSRAEREKVFTLLKAHPDFPNISKRAGSSREPGYELLLFMYAACWPDSIRTFDRRFVNEQRHDLSQVQALEGFPDMGVHLPWHYKLQGFMDDGTSVVLPDVSFDGDVQSKIFDFKMSIGTPGVSEAHKGYFLSWLLHAVGDAHHPLHCASRVTPGRPRGDAFGSQFEIHPMELPGVARRVTNLHDFWDVVLGEGTSLPAVRTLAEFAEQHYTPRLEAADLNEAEWVKESFESAKGWAYEPLTSQPGQRRITPTYSDGARFLLIRRVKLAGERLAGVLSQTLMYYTPPETPEPSQEQATSPQESAAKDGGQGSKGFFSAPIRAAPAQAHLLEESARKTAERKQSLRDELARLEPKRDAEVLKTVLLSHIVAARQEVVAFGARVPNSAGEFEIAEKMFFEGIAARYDEHLESVRKSRPREYAATRDRTLRLLDASHRALAGAAKGDLLTFDLEVVSAPEGANLLLKRDGDAGYTSDGKKTPVTLRNIMLATWHFRVELPGYKTQDKTLHATDDPSRVLTFQLEPQPPPPAARGEEGGKGGRPAGGQRRGRTRTRRR